MLIGKAPLKSKTGAALAQPDILRNLPVSRHYASLLADLAREKGFDGYLLNFERDLLGRSEQVRAIEAWATILKMELERKVGNHAEMVWHVAFSLKSQLPYSYPSHRYDSIVTTGDVRWQNRLNSRNVNFFLASDSFFTNYWWPTPYPSICAQYLLGMDADLVQDRPKSFRDIYMGIDVWGRGSHGNGGMALYKAAEHIDPEFMGLSIAIFGPAWSWESDEGSDDWSWEKWWTRERTLWAGPDIEGSAVDVPDWPQREGEPPCEHGAFRPVSDFFSSMPPPNPSALAFYTSFSPGVGFSWFIEGKKATSKPTGWTDVDKQTSLGNLLWPRPKLEWEVQNLDAALPKGTNTVDFSDAFNGGSSLALTLRGEGSKTDENAFQCFWVPVQSLSLTPGQVYEAQLIYKVDSEDCDLDLALSVKAHTDAVNLDVNPISERIVDNFANGWSKVSITCKAASPSGDDTRASIGIVLGAVFNDATSPYTIIIQLGQLSVFPNSPVKNAVAYETKLLWANCEHEALADNQGASIDTLSLTWDLAVAFTAPAVLRDIDLMPETPRPPWVLDRSRQWYPRLLYANVYAEKRDLTNERQFLGTSGAMGGPCRFAINYDALPKELRNGAVRFYVQGVTDRGVVLPWEKCVYVDHQW